MARNYFYSEIEYGYLDIIEQMKKRARVDLLYLDNISLLTNIKIILATM